jgi:pimeloyl-ACP methyl ester carboxylesterase
MKKVLNGINITYRYHKGTCGKTVLLLHGWGGSLNSFKHLENYLIINNFSVITLDFPGFGGSDLPSIDWTLNDYVKVVQELLDAENINKVSIVCHSFGGRVALLFASEISSKVEKLVLVDSAGIKPKFSIIKSFKIFKYKCLKTLKKIGIVKKDLNNYGSADYRAMPEKLKPVFNRIVTTDLSQQSKKITAPTLIVWGKDDEDTPFYMAKKLNKNIKDSAIITFEGGHFAYLNNASKFALIVDEFLK